MAPTKHRRWFFFGVFVFISAFGIVSGVRALRHDTDGLRNAFSLSYWESRKAGKDMLDRDRMVLKRGSREFREVALTIDDGPIGLVDERILDLLDREKVKATFFLVGKQIAKFPELVKRMVVEGHDVGNHSLTHPRLTKISTEAAEKELDGCESAFKAATGRKFLFMRPPGMQYNESITRMTKQRGYILVDYTAGAHDFAEPTAGEIEENIVKQVRPGAILLLHDRDRTLDALPNIIRRLREDGYKFVTISEMLAHLPDPLLVQTANPVR